MNYLRGAHPSYMYSLREKYNHVQDTYHNIMVRILVR